VQREPKTAMRNIIRSVEIFSCTKNGKLGKVALREVPESCERNCKHLENKLCGTYVETENAI
jgi:hypothetical protein